jgi:hypothetical protein
MFKKENIIVKGMYNFGLKSVGKAMSKHKMIETIWDENISNGLDSMVIAVEIYQKCKEQKININSVKEFQHIINYNEIDCKIMMDILLYIKKNIH